MGEYTIGETAAMLGVGIPLETIAQLIDAPSHTLRTALNRHRAELAN